MSSSTGLRMEQRDSMDNVEVMKTQIDGGFRREMDFRRDDKEIESQAEWRIFSRKKRDFSAAAKMKNLKQQQKVVGLVKKKIKMHSELHKSSRKSKKPTSKLVAQKPLKNFLEILIKILKFSALDFL